MSDRCARAFTLLCRVYDLAQKAVVFLRWEHGDADAIAPSLFDNGGGRPKRARPDSSPSGTPEAPTNEEAEEASAVSA